MTLMPATISRQQMPMEGWEDFFLDPMPLGTTVMVDASDIRMVTCRNYGTGDVADVLMIQLVDVLMGEALGYLPLSMLTLRTH